jgi:hypothetical protein
MPHSNAHSTLVPFRGQILITPLAIIAGHDCFRMRFPTENLTPKVNAVNNSNTESATDRTAPSKPISYVRIALACDRKGSVESSTVCCGL